MNTHKLQFDGNRAAFTLVETLTVLALSAVLLTAVLQMYHRVRRDVSQLTGHLEDNRLTREILHKIAEDIDRLAAPGFDAKIQFRNKYDNGHNAAQLTLENNFYGKGNPPRQQLYERVIWQTTYDPFSESLILYRMHEGLNLEDKVLAAGSDVASGERLFIPITEGLTHFEVQSLMADEVSSAAWTSDTLPTAVRIGISFAPLEELPDGSIGVPEEAILYRSVAVDRSRFIAYEFIRRQLDVDDLDAADPNEADMDQAWDEDEFDEFDEFDEDLDPDTEQDGNTRR